MAFTILSEFIKNIIIIIIVFLILCIVILKAVSLSLKNKRPTLWSTELSSDPKKTKSSTRKKR